MQNAMRNAGAGIALCLGALGPVAIASAYEGFGAVTQGAGSCPTSPATYHVTSLADSGSGTLRDAVSQSCRNIVFDLAGTITLQSHLRVRTSYLTIDGASAPAPGITISQPTVNTGVMIESSSSASAHDIIVHHLRHQGPGGHSDSIADMWGLDGEANPVYNVVLDHLTLSGSNDGTMDLYGDVRDVTLSWNLVKDTTTALHLSHDDSLRERISFHHNVFARNNERQIRMRHQNGVLDFVNNVVYGWGWEGCAARALDFPSGSINDNEWPKINVEKNRYHHVPGLACGDADDAITRDVTGRIYFDGNSFPAGETDAVSSSPRHAIPAGAEVTKYDASTLGSTVVPCVGTHHPTAAETTLLQQVATAIGGNGAPCGGAVVPTLSLGDASVTEGNAGTTPATFTATLSAAAAQPVTVAYATGGGTAAAGTDYQTASGLLTFGPGTLTRTLAVNVVGDTQVESDETFLVTLSSPTGATLGDAQGQATISDDDTAGVAGSELAHGSRIAARFDGQDGTPGVDLYRLSQAPRASYEVVVDGASGDAMPVALERMAADGSTVLQTSVAVGSGRARALRWHNTSTSAVANQSVRVRSGACATSCGADDVYRVRAYETTYAAARFNNNSTQATSVLIQNATASPVSGRAYFWSTSGALLGSQAVSVPARGLVAIPTPSVPGLAGQAGSITLAHDGPFGALTGKSVAVEPASGYSFDSPLLPRSR
jgi:pectate lyase